MKISDLKKHNQKDIRQIKQLCCIACTYTADRKQMEKRCCYL